MILKMKIYLSGPVTGVENYVEKFEQSEILIKDIFGCEVFNPVSHIRNVFKSPEEIGWPFIMSILLDELKNGGYTHLCMLDGWEDSHGATVENIFARKLGMTVFTEKEIKPPEATK